MNAAQALANWIRGVRSGEAALADKRRKLEAHRANPPTSADVAEHRAWLATARELEDDIAAEEAALRIAQQKQAEAQQAADEAAIDAEAKLAERDVREAAKLTLEIGDDAPRLAAKLNRLAELKANVDAYNAKRGDRPYIADGERRVREVPEKHTPAVYETMAVWTHPTTGRKPSQYREVNGELVPADHGAYVKTTERFVSCPERTTPAHFPGGRFTDTIKLIGLKGEPLFPAR